MKAPKTVFLIIVAFLAGLAGAWIGTPKDASVLKNGAAKESAFDRVMRTQTLRCGYGIWPPLLIKDTNTGELSGTVHDYMEALGSALKLKIEWTEETGWGDFPAALASGRIDAMCAGVWPSSARAREVDFSVPIAYQGIYAYVRADDTRFDGKLDAINDPAVSVVTMDGEISSLIALSDFPDARKLSLPQLTTAGEMFANVVAQKGDVVLTDSITGAQYETSNPGKIRRVESVKPLRVFGNTIALPQGEERLRRMLDTSTRELLANGQIEKILAKYEQVPGSLLRVAPDYVAYQSKP